MSQPRNHHYLPRCYLREFSPNKSFGDNVYAVHLVGRKKVTNPHVPPYVPPKTCRLVNVENIGAERDRNSICDLDTNELDHGTIESIFNKLEGVYPNVVSELYAYAEWNFDENHYCEITDEDLVVAIKLLTIITYSRLPELDSSPLILNNNKKFSQLVDTLLSLKEIIVLINRFSEGRDDNTFHDDFDMDDLKSLVDMKDVLDRYSALPQFADFFDTIDNGLFKMIERTVKFCRYKDLLKDNLNFYLVGASPELKFITCEHPFIIREGICAGFTFVITPELALHYSALPLEPEEASVYVSQCNSYILNNAKKFLAANEEELLNKYINEWHLIKSGQV